MKIMIVISNAICLGFFNEVMEYSSSTFEGWKGHQVLSKKINQSTKRVRVQIGWKLQGVSNLRR